MFSKKFDVHFKTKDDINQQGTVIGAFLTICSVLIVITLVFFEMSLFVQTDVVTRLVVDSSKGLEAVRIDVDLVFPKLTCDRLKFSQEVTRGNIHTFEINHMILETIDNGCWIHGYIITDQVGGNFKLTVNPQMQALPGQNDQFLLPDLTHDINRIMFIHTNGNDGDDVIKGVEHSLNGVRTDLSSTNVGLYQYAIQVVPTEYNNKKGDKLQSNQYSVTERQVAIESMSQGVTIAGSTYSDIGIVFTYDFYPLMLIMDEQNEGIIEFCVTLCGIVGGVITVLSLIERCLHHGAKAIIGKQD